MSKKQKLVEARKKEYDSLKPNLATQLAPRPGYYLIKESTQGLIEQFKCPLAKATWKPSCYDIFNPHFECEIELKSLLNPLSVGPKERLKQDLNGRVIEVYLSKVVRRPIKGVIRNSLMVYWDLLKITKRELERKNKVQSNPYKFYFDSKFSQSGELPF